ncbi:hypothetical protein C4D60_Mb01t05670 [Musa balbisiana]|uniref:Uncharacterized protein n=1 Tax=Musa balbisiana TaxID=52838 RepID=A0A4S8JK29_MUSBA|nr:hypothetical protein C4D60_Mb01t05670 [Musa balbisiana]
MGPRDLPPIKPPSSTSPSSLLRPLSFGSTNSFGDRWRLAVCCWWGFLKFLVVEFRIERSNFLGSPTSGPFPGDFDAAILFGSAVWWWKHPFTNRWIEGNPQLEPLISPCMD